MAKFTLLEVHLDGAEFTANAPYSSGEADEDAGIDLPFGEDEGDEATESTTDGGGANPFGIVFAFVGLVLGVVALRRILGGSGEPVLETGDSGEAESGGLRARL
ncbi:hypothetical protein [Halosimplex pelagicum]|uniref:Uncharacterized protein n=1 Tax=Halosimplex pelagicum TaxID=869886 RepID=A0A7D5PB96_9EURY|nr:hypothetical protein [Halosimplex pelagicum]QLH83981.1 hypothetical protein HZS54_21110 [Halosimplex pelagicum]